MMNATPAEIKPPLLLDEVVAQIRRKILDGSFAPGERLPAERELASSLRVNRSSIREALKKLEQLRLVEIQPGSGARVRDAEHASFEIVSSLISDGAEPDAAGVQELLELREIVLAGTLQLALLRASDAELETCAADLRRAASLERSDAEFLESLRELQVVFARMTHNRVLRILANSLARFLAEQGPLRAPGDLVAERKKLRPLLQRLGVAISARDSETADRAGRELLRRSTKLFADGIRA